MRDRRITIHITWGSAASHARGSRHPLTELPSSPTNFPIFMSFLEQGSHYHLFRKGGRAVFTKHPYRTHAYPYLSPQPAHTTPHHATRV